MKKVIIIALLCMLSLGSIGLFMLDGGTGALETDAYPVHFNM